MSYEINQQYPGTGNSSWVIIDLICDQDDGTDLVIARDADGYYGVFGNQPTINGTNLMSSRRENLLPVPTIEEAALTAWEALEGQYRIVIREIRVDKKITAIKLFKQLTGLGLSASKFAVENCN